MIDLTLNIPRLLQGHLRVADEIINNQSSSNGSISSSGWTHSALIESKSVLGHPAYIAQSVSTSNVVLQGTSPGSCPTSHLQKKKKHYKKDLVSNPVWWEAEIKIVLLSTTYFLEYVKVWKKFNFLRNFS